MTGPAESKRAKRAASKKQLGKKDSLTGSPFARSLPKEPSRVGPPSQIVPDSKQVVSDNILVVNHQALSNKNTSALTESLNSLNAFRMKLNPNDMSLCAAALMRQLTRICRQSLSSDTIVTPDMAETWAQTYMKTFAAITDQAIFLKVNQLITEYFANKNLNGLQPSQYITQQLPTELSALNQKLEKMVTSGQLSLSSPDYASQVSNAADRTTEEEELIQRQNNPGCCSSFLSCVASICRWTFCLPCTLFSMCCCRKDTPDTGSVNSPQRQSSAVIYSGSPIRGREAKHYSSVASTTAVASASAGSSQSQSADSVTVTITDDQSSTGLTA